jgi:hypothetical protein
VASTGSDWRALLGNEGTPAGDLVRLASDPAAEVAALAALAGDAAVLRRAPALVAALYRNAHAPMTVAHRAIVTARQAEITCDDFPELAELAAQIEADPGALDPAQADVNFAAVLAATSGAALAEADSEAVVAPVVDAAPAAAQAKRRSAIIDFSKLKLYEKIRLATLGNAYCRQNLLRDANRMVALAAIRSPQITDGEVAKAAGNRALSEDVVRYIANRKEMVKQYAVKLALVGNAKCPLAIALRLLPSLHGEDIKQLARSKNIPGALSAAAKKLAAARGPQ